MNEYTGPDEYPIQEIPDTAQWSENFAAMFVDPSGALSIMYSIGRWHGDPTLWREFILISLADQRLLYHRGYGRTGDKRGPGGSLSYYEIIEPGRSARLQFDGPVSESVFDSLMSSGPDQEPPAKRCKIDMRFDALAPLWNMKGDSVEASMMAGAMHIDHIGVANGTLKYEGKTYTISQGYSVRDHSRGVRDMSPYGAHCWINGCFPGGRAFYLYAMRLQGQQELGMENAAVAQGQTLYPAKLLHTDLISSAADAKTTHRLVLESDLGRMEVEVSKVLTCFPISMVMPFDTAVGRLNKRNSALMFDETVSLSWAGEQGIGWSERGVASEPL